MIFYKGITKCISCLHKLYIIIIIAFVFIYLLCALFHMPRYACLSQRTTCRIQFSASTGDSWRSDSGLQPWWPLSFLPSRFINPSQALSIMFCRENILNLTKAQLVAIFFYGLRPWCTNKFLT